MAAALLLLCVTSTGGGTAGRGRIEEDDLLRLLGGRLEVVVLVGIVEGREVEVVVVIEVEEEGRGRGGSRREEVEGGPKRMLV